MSKIAITGAGGFLGLHVRAAARELGVNTVAIPVGPGFDVDHAVGALDGATRLIHLAGVNRGTDAEIQEGNALFVQQLGQALERCERAPESVIFANSIQAGNGTVYGTAKQRAGAELGTAVERADSTYEDVLLPNLFGEYGRPHYNSVVATFSHVVARGGAPEVHQDKELQLLHAQDAADIMLGVVGASDMDRASHRETVAGILGHLQEFAAHYTSGELPDLSSPFRRDLFNTYRAYAFPENMPLPITRHADKRGSFFEIVRSHGGTGQTSFSTTAPGITRGDHFHRRKVERFTVLSGTAEIRLRRLFDDQVFTYTITGDEPKSVDMPTLYAHNISNVGDDTLYTAFWTNDIFDPSNPDTIPETV
ncbi:SDR family oxidoreductase [Citricoccus sp. SGAir0253]|uniref:polysaccharide biosynthesis C-terminal domain-containing protein n=1 Tax=Citricoccus sp. SGAir0253 TaxID=2567881 RepID=UPI0010CCDD53|nr:SDR family oxidoreductase [Citricoccus sp. SGAir0253]QCU77547.1 SDR family oxidoreductase [Citricoccus sp. SGAir0253]